MSRPSEFSFEDTSTAASYDDVLVPALFRPWAEQLVEANGPWEGVAVLDLGTGTGVVAELLAARVGPRGKVVGSDINAGMLARARQRCAGATSPVEFVESPAHPLELPDDSFDAVVCQQAFQFFPDRAAAAREILRVLRRGGRVVVTVWRPVVECRPFEVICDALEEIGEPEIAGMMRLPFDFLPGEELKSHFESAGFGHVRVDRKEGELVVPGGVEQALDMVYATPIAPKLRELPESQQAKFRAAFTRRFEDQAAGGENMGSLATNVLTARKTE